jgi:hypothetical protein
MNKEQGMMIKEQGMMNFEVIQRVNTQKKPRCGA